MEKRVSQKKESAEPQLRVTLYSLCANERSTEWKSRRRVEALRSAHSSSVSRCFADRKGLRKTKKGCEMKGTIKRKKKDAR